MGRSTEGLQTLVLGSGLDPQLQAVNLDRVALPNTDVVHDATVAPWPFPDERFSKIESSHVLEHIPHQVLSPNGGFEPLDGLVILMNEAWRVLKPGGRFEISVPHGSTAGALQDPTHCRYFVEQSYFYFGRPEVCVPYHEDFTGRKWNWDWYGSDYGINARFDIMLNEVRGTNLYTVLRKPSENDAPYDSVLTGDGDAT